jgi:hypothetical protein
MHKNSTAARPRRTLVSHRRYFGVDAFALRESAGRVLARVVGLPVERARVSARHVRHDFGVDTVEGQALVARLVAGGLLRPHVGERNDLEPTPRLAEFASARIVDPLPRTKARQLVERSIGLAAEINRSWSRNPFAIAILATFGDYLTPDADLAELRLGLIVQPRPRSGLTRWRTLVDAHEGGGEIRSAYHALSSYVRVSLAGDAKALPRPFSVAWKDEGLA